MIFRSSCIRRGFTTRNVLGNASPDWLSASTKVLPSCDSPSVPAGVYGKPHSPTSPSWFNSVPSLVEIASSSVLPDTGSSTGTYRVVPPTTPLPPDTTVSGPPSARASGTVTMATIAATRQSKSQRMASSFG